MTNNPHDAESLKQISCRVGPKFQSHIIPRTTRVDPTSRSQPNSAPLSPSFATVHPIVESFRNGFSPPPFSLGPNIIKGEDHEIFRSLGGQSLLSVYSPWIPLMPITSSWSYRETLPQASSTRHPLFAVKEYGGFPCYETGQTFALVLSSQQTGCCPQHTASRVLRLDCSFGAPPPLHLSETHRQG